MQIQENISIAQHNTFGVDVDARFFSTFSDVSLLKEGLEFSKNQKTSTLILGGGSNVLFTKSVDAFVFKNELKGLSVVKEDSDFSYIKASAGEVWHELVLYTVGKGLSGIENLSLIPGCCGAAPMQNIGAYGVELKDVFHELEALNVDDYSTTTFSLKDCEFGYRESVFKRKLRNRFVITNITLKLKKHPEFNTSYGAIEQEIEKMGVKELSVKAISDAVCSIRRSKLPDPKVLGNAGSFFKNPVVPQSVYDAIRLNYSDAPNYPAGEGHVKMAAGWLIEKAGWKGKKVGNCGVHDKQALVLVNHGGATGNEIYALSESVIQSIKTQFGIELEREVNIY